MADDNPEQGTDEVPAEKPAKAPAKPPAKKPEPKTKDRIEVFVAARPDGTEVTVRRNIDTGVSEVE